MKKNLFLFLIIIIVSCSKKDKAPAPGKATLIFPEQNAVCTNGSVISDTQSSIVFSWNTSTNTDSYEVSIKNLLTHDVSTQVTGAHELKVTLKRNTPYAWFVKSMSGKSNDTTLSDTWKFYNSGPGSTSYPPFPAAITSPGFGVDVNASGGKINVKWKGADPDNDITGYDVCFGSNATPPILKSNITDMFLNDITVTSGTVYYCKVITHDSNGNTSDSGIWQFRVN